MGMGDLLDVGDLSREAKQRVCFCCLAQQSTTAGSAAARLLFGCLWRPHHESTAPVFAFFSHLVDLVLRDARRRPLRPRERRQHRLVDALPQPLPRRRA